MTIETPPAPVLDQHPVIEPPKKRGLARVAAWLFGPRKPQTVEGLDTPGGDVGTRLAQERTTLASERTELALDRSFLASERTLMGWIRTALSMISFGFTLGKLGDVLKDVEVQGVFRMTRSLSIAGIAYFLVTVGTFALFGATLQHVFRTRTYRVMGLTHRFSLAVPVAVLLILIGAFALTALVAKL